LNRETLVKAIEIRAIPSRADKKNIEIYSFEELIKNSDANRDIHFPWRIKKDNANQAIQLIKSLRAAGISQKLIKFACNVHFENFPEIDNVAEVSERNKVLLERALCILEVLLTLLTRRVQLNFTKNNNLWNSQVNINEKRIFLEVELLRNNKARLHIFGETKIISSFASEDYAISTKKAIEILDDLERSFKKLSQMKSEESKNYLEGFKKSIIHLLEYLREKKFIAAESIVYYNLSRGLMEIHIASKLIKLIKLVSRISRDKQDIFENVLKILWLLARKLSNNSSG